MKRSEQKELTALKYTAIRKDFCKMYAKGIHPVIIYDKLKAKYFLRIVWLQRIVNAPDSEVLKTKRLIRGAHNTIELLTE